MNNWALTKTFARLIAVQTIYSKSNNNEGDARKIAEDFTLYYKDQDCKQEIDIAENSEMVKINKGFLYKLIDVVFYNLEEIDGNIKEFLNGNWRLDNLDLIMHSILRAAVAEILFFKDVPEKVVINEYISISKSFYDEKDIGFVNGILDKIAKSKRV